jgi:hypothetical protein
MSGEELYVLALQLGMQYLIPAAGLLRALASGVRGRLPEGVRDIGGAAFVAGLGALADGNADSVGEAVLQVFTNTVFIAGLLSFTLVYLLRLPNWGKWFDALLGGIVGLIAWGAWVYLFNNDWSIWTAPLAIIAGGLAYVVLRSLLRQVRKLALFATRIFITAVVLAVVGGLIWVGVQVF